MGALCRHPPPCSMRLSTDINEAAQPSDLLVLFVEEVATRKGSATLHRPTGSQESHDLLLLDSLGSTHHPIEVKSEVGVVYHASAHATFGACAFQNIRICTTLTRAHLTLLLFNNI